MSDDNTFGYDEHANDYVALRSDVGAELLGEWAKDLRPGANVLDLAAGSGEPVTAALIATNRSVFAIDASPNMVGIFRKRFPDIPIRCETVESGQWFERSFDGVTAIGIMFLLPKAEQGRLIRRVSEVLMPGGRFLFSAPWQTGEWRDNITGHMSWSLGRDAYHRLIKAAGLHIDGEVSDGNGNHYYRALKPDD